MYPTLEPFSAGFNMIDLSVVPAEGNEPRIQKALYEDIMYWTAEIESTNEDVPMLFRYPRHGGYFEVAKDTSVPADVIELPEELIRSFGIDRLPELETFLVTKPKYAKQLDTLYLSD